MIYSFSTAIDDAYDWQNHELWEALIGAVNERLAAWRPGQFVGTEDLPSGFISTFAVGSHIQQSSWWNRQPDHTQTTAPFYWGLQTGVGALITSYIDHRITIEGMTTQFGYNDFHLITWTMAALRSAASLPTIVQTDSVFDSFPTMLAALPANSSWRRKRPREVASEWDTIAPYAYAYDRQGNAASLGQVAWGIYPVVPGSLPPAGGTALKKCTSVTTTPPTWDPVFGTLPITTTAEGPMPDVLDNTLSAPSAIVTDSVLPGNNNSIPFNLNNPANQVEPGDYIGWWLFEEVRQVVNLMRRSAVTVGFATVSSYYAQVTSTVSYADAIDQFNSTWGPGGIPGGLVSPIAGPIAFIQSDFSGGTWEIQGQRTAISFGPAFGGSLPASNKEIDMYVYATIAVAGPGGTGVPDAFDAQGDDVNEGSWHKILTSAQTTATTYTFSKFTDETMPPPNFPPDPAVAGRSRKGYQINDAFAVMRFDLAGSAGFQFMF